VSSDAGQLAFHAFGTAGEEGIYLAGADDPDFLVAGLATPLPGGGGSFTGFGGVATDAGLVIVAAALGSRRPRQAAPQGCGRQG
jgi:hypothetical protein